LSPLQADEIFACLDRRHVRYILIGGLAAVLQGSPLATFDIGICPARDPDNLRRLAEALEELEARIRTPGDADGVAFPRGDRLPVKRASSEPRHSLRRFRYLFSAVRHKRLRGPVEELSRDSSQGHRATLPPLTTSSDRRKPPTDPRISDHCRFCGSSSKRFARRTHERLPLNLIHRSAFDRITP
jgi:hypothetical protein